MKNKTFSIICSIMLCLAMLFSVVACGKPTPESTGSNVESTESTETPKGMISAKPLSLEQLGEGFNSKYLPDTKSIRQLSGKIDVCLDFEGTQAGWNALAREYERLQGGGVVVNINETYAGSTYTDKLNTELTATKTDWDIIEGNLGYDNTMIKCFDMYSNIAAPNAYCGENVKWSEVLKPEAYKTKEADNSGKSIIMNTEVMQTCWFVNDVAFQAAVEKGYVNADGDAEYPITWDDLISLCEKMEEAGYENPLGITLCNASIESLQFTWLLRVYGDYYYRQFYQYIMAGEAGTIWENYDPTEDVVENLAGYGYKFSKILALLFDRECSFGPGYVGFYSDVYRDFVSQLAKMKGHLMVDVASTEFADLRDQFETQSKGKKSPQIMLDYQGFGITYERAESSAFSVGYFDYPEMVSGVYEAGKFAGQKIVPEGTITRDIGGNGGFISVVRHLGDTAQNDLNKDFVKFVLSPYGQTIYYQGLAKANKVPKGLSTVKNDLVVIPSEWVNFFNESSKTISFNGDVDANIFLSWGVRYLCGYTETQKIICDNWRGLLVSGLAADQQLDVAGFVKNWDEAVISDAKAMTAANGWPNDVWTNPNYNL